MTGVTRRDFLKAAGAGTAGAAMFSASAGLSGRTGEYLPRGGSRMNVVLILVDSLRKDHIGAYGNEWVQTPSLDTLAGDSLRFTRAYPESTPTITARRAIHTGFRSFPFRDYEYPGEFDVRLLGWQPVPSGQATLAEILRDQGYSTALVTDTLHMFRPTYNFHRGFDVFDFIRGQERDLYRPLSRAPQEALEKVLISGEGGGRMREIMRQYLVNIRGRGGARRTGSRPGSSRARWSCWRPAGTSNRSFSAWTPTTPTSPGSRRRSTWTSTPVPTMLRSPTYRPTARATTSPSASCNGCATSTLPRSRW
jgi:hypothetical protein